MQFSSTGGLQSTQSLKYFAERILLVRNMQSFFLKYININPHMAHCTSSTVYRSIDQSVSLELVCSKIVQCLKRRAFSFSRLSVLCRESSKWKQFNSRGTGQGEKNNKKKNGKIHLASLVCLVLECTIYLSIYLEC